MKVKLKYVKLSFPHLFRASEKFGKFGANFIFDKGSEADKTINDAIKTVMREKWGTKADTVLAKIKESGKGGYVRDGDNQDAEGYAGKNYLRTSSNIRPECRNRDASPLIESDGVLYAGAEVIATLDISTFKNDYGTHLSARLLGVQFVKDGPRLSGEPTVDDKDFTPLTGEDD